MSVILPCLNMFLTQGIAALGDKDTLSEPNKLLGLHMISWLMTLIFLLKVQEHLRSCKCQLGTVNSSTVPCKVSVIFPEKYILEWTTKEKIFIPKLMLLVLGNRCALPVPCTKTLQKCG